MKTVDNAAVDVLAAAVPAPYGPFTRVTDFELYPVPNSGIRGTFTSNLSVSVQFSAEELENAALTLKLNRQYHSTPGVWTPIVADMIATVTEADALADAMASPHTYEDYTALRSKLLEIAAVNGNVVGFG